MHRFAFLLNWLGSLIVVLLTWHFYVLAGFQLFYLEQINKLLHLIGASRVFDLPISFHKHIDLWKFIKSPLNQISTNVQYLVMAIAYFVSKDLMTRYQDHVLTKYNLQQMKIDDIPCESMRILHKENIDRQLTESDVMIAKSQLKKVKLWKPDFMFWFLVVIVVSIYQVKAGISEILHSDKFFIIILCCYFFDIILNLNQRKDLIAKRKAKYDYLNEEYKKRFNYDRSSHGSASWMADEHKRRLINSEHSGLVVNGVVDVYEAISEESSFTHTLVLAPTGYGKSTTFIMPNLFFPRNNASYIVTDPSKELYNVTSKYLYDQGFDIVLLQPLTPAESFCWNPFYGINNISDAKKIADTIVYPLVDNTPDPFWGIAASSCLSSLVMILSLLDREYAQNNQTFCTANNIRYLIGESREIISLLVDQLDTNGTLKEEYRSGYGRAPKKTADSIGVSLSSCLSVFGDSFVRQVAANHNFDFSILRKKKTIVYVVVPENEMRRLSPYLTLFFQQFMAAMIQLPEHDDLSVYGLFDEFGNFAPVADLTTYITTLRKRSVSLSLILQDVQQLQKLYPRDWETIQSNLVNKLYYPGLDNKACEYISKTLGKFTFRTSSDSVGMSSGSSQSENTTQNTERKSSGKSHSETYNSGATYVSTSRDLMMPDEVRKLERGKVIYIPGNNDPTIVNSFPFDKTALGVMLKKQYDQTRETASDHMSFDKGVIKGISIEPLINEIKNKIQNKERTT